MRFMTAGFTFRTIHSGVACMAGKTHLNCLLRCALVVLSTIACSHSYFQFGSSRQLYEVLNEYVVMMSVVNAAYAYKVSTGSPVSRQASNRAQSFSIRFRMRGSMRLMACFEKNGIKVFRRRRCRSCETVPNMDELLPNISTDHDHLSRFWPGPL